MSLRIRSESARSFERCETWHVSGNCLMCPLRFVTRDDEGLCSVVDAGRSLPYDSDAAIPSWCPLRSCPVVVELKP